MKKRRAAGRRNASLKDAPSAWLEDCHGVHIPVSFAQDSSLANSEILNKQALRRILILDGAMGSLIQSFGLTEADFRGERFASHSTDLKGCNDLLCVTKPDVIAGIHDQYLKAGADIIKTCSFSANALSLADYGVAGLAYEINRAAASIAREVADRYASVEKPRFVAGSMGPTSKSAAISPDVNDPAARSVTWDALEAAYYDQARGLLDGGADMLLVETIFDALNAKSALAAIMSMREERRIDIPVMVSATISGPSGRILSGQTIAAFCVSIAHAGPWSIGLNCSFGADALLPYIRQIAASAPCLVSVHPNAGLPNLSGGYDDTPEIMADTLDVYMKEGLLNIAGGCCGSTPAHIAAIAEKAKAHAPRIAPRLKLCTALSGLEALRMETIEPLRGEYAIVPIGERTNVAGSRKFLRLIKEDNFAEAANIARESIAAGAKIIDVCMDDALLDAKAAMKEFMNLALSDPCIAAVPMMVDSSNWEVIEEGLKCIQGKALVNSISLKEGGEAFLRKARLARRYGAAVVVMLFDEDGQAAAYERKTAVAERSYTLLTQDGFPAEDIVFDPNVLSIATGIPEHDTYAHDFIRACAWIKSHCPGVHISGGISNLSFSFRGNDAVRNALHAVFLRNAAEAGLTMAIVNPASLVPCAGLAPDLRTAAEDVILCRAPKAGDPAASERLLSLALSRTGARAPRAPAPSGDSWRENAQSEEERIVYALVHGIDTHIEADALALISKKQENGMSGEKAALEIVEGPLMEAMQNVGVLFGEGGLFLPQVIRSARVMKKAVAALDSFFAQETNGGAGGSAPAFYGKQERNTKKVKILLATVKGDVHDIGKNIVGVALACNGCEIIDLGVMAPCENILEAAVKEKVDIVGLSGLITASLEEMIIVARSMEAQRFTIPLFIGGAAASRVHTALRIACEYSGPVVYSSDAGHAVAAVRSLLSETERPMFLEKLKQSYDEAIEEERRKTERKRRTLISLEEARKNRFSASASIPKPRQEGVRVFTAYPLERVIPYINWNAFISSWDMSKSPRKEKESLFLDAKNLLRQVAEENLLTLKAVVGFFPVAVENEDVIIPGRIPAHFHFPRNRDPQKEGVPNPSLADFIASDKKNEKREGWLGLFALSAGFGVKEAQAAFALRHDGGASLLIASLANALAEAFAEELHCLVRKELWGYAPDEQLAPEEAIAGKYQGIRPAFGYPAAPSLAGNRAAFAVLQTEENIGITLTSSAMMMPEASVCGMYIAHPDAYYFNAG
ncbi:MAG: methionine synthase [Treponema sp.]|jgi:5-methyltetrahydrofolate--homocysteine methyltransferase|nr:methionine synthase [Treponema sp.]